MKITVKQLKRLVKEAVNEVRFDSPGDYDVKLEYFETPDGRMYKVQGRFEVLEPDPSVGESGGIADVWVTDVKEYDVDGSLQHVNVDAFEIGLKKKTRKKLYDKLEAAAEVVLMDIQDYKAGV